MTAFVVLLALAAPSIKLEGGNVVVTGLAAAPARPAEALTVHVGDVSRPGMLGTARMDGKSLVFVPRFPLRPGVRYLAVLHVGPKPVTASLLVPAVERKPTAVVAAVFPTASTLPENQLKFYIHFSRPMSQGGSYKHIRLLDEKGKAVDLPFLELDQELWDPAGRRFTLFFDPGRIKRGLKPREDHGPALVEGKRYTLEISREWEDADGTPMKVSFKKAFKVAAPDDSPPDPKKWAVSGPDLKGTLRVSFGKPMDSALAERLLRVEDAVGKKVPGKVRLIRDESVWLFDPAAAWKPGNYDLVADTLLEDLSGNSIGRPFEVDVLRPVEKAIKTETVKLPFRVK